MPPRQSQQPIGCTALVLLYLIFVVIIVLAIVLASHLGR